MGPVNGIISELRRRLFEDGWCMSWKFYTQMTHHLDAIRDSDDYKSNVADIEADLRKQELDFDPASL